MQKINNILKKYSIKPYRYEKKGKVNCVEASNGKYALKKRLTNNNDIMEYLNTRSFDYFPELLAYEDDIEIRKYIEQASMPDEQKLLDMIDLVALLHNKTTHYKEALEDDYKKTYEEISNNIIYLESYYTDLITIIESKVYMSPSEFLIARNISKIFSSLQFCKHEIEAWYELVKDKKKQRMTVVHNNLDLSHFIRNQNSYLLSWDKAKIDIPIFDLYKLYKRQGLDFEFEPILKKYERHYPLKPEERKLFFILIALPDLIEYKETEYETCKDINRKIDFIYKTEQLLSPYYSNEKEENSNPE